MPDNITREEFENLRLVVKGVIEAMQRNVSSQKGLQKQIELLTEAIQLLKKLNGV